MTVDIIIPNFNGSKLIEKNVPHVLTAMSRYKGKLIIVDDGSSVEDREALRNIVAYFRNDSNREIDYIEHSHNKGFSSAVNSGVSNSDADYVVLLNSDVEPSHNFLESPLEKLERDDSLFAVGCMDVSIEGEKEILRGRGIARWVKGLLEHSRGEVDKEDTFWVSGGSSVFRRKFYKRLGGMDEIYNPFYWEDIDLSYRAQKAGLSILFDKSSIVEHLHAEGAIKKNIKKDKVTYTAYRNQFIFVWKNITDGKLLFSHFIYLPFHCLGALKRGDGNFFKGFFLALVRLPAIIIRRHKQKSFYTRSDVEVIKYIS